MNRYDLMSPKKLRREVFMAVGRLPVTNAEKREAVKMFLDDLQQSRRSNGEIARVCGVSRALVGTVRKELEIREQQRVRLVDAAYKSLSPENQRVLRARLEHIDAIEAEMRSLTLARPPNQAQSP
jgi:hypothetical protein